MIQSKLFKSISIATRLLSIGASAILWYCTYKYVYKQINNELDNENKTSDDYVDCYKVIRMKIPSYSKGAIIGKNGSTIKKLQDQTKTTIKFVAKSDKTNNNSDKDSCLDDWNIDLTKDNVNESFEILMVRGLTLRVMEAEKAIKIVIDSVPVYSVDDMFIDNRFVGKIIGKKGENIRRLKDLYKVQIDIDKTTNVQRQITFRGTSSNICECKRDIIKIIDDEIIKENRFVSQPRVQHHNVNDLITENTNVTKAINFDKEEFQQQYVTYPGGLNEKVDIYVSSVVNCGKFYAHVINENLSLLDNLIEDMTNTFSKTTPCENAVFNVGDIVAGFYEPSQTWQRVKIIGKENNVFEIIYLDYGDCTKVKFEELRVFEPKSIFLQLPFQGLRLMTYGIEPIGDNWTESDINEFESLTKVGCSYKISAILKKNNPLNLEVQLIDEEMGIYIVEKLVNCGKAKLCN